MRIIEFTAENVKKLKVVNIKPTTDVVQITGKNKSGKSSVLDSIYWALAGKKVIQSKPIREGTEEARIRLDLGTMIVKRTFDADGNTTVLVLNPVGADPGTPEKKLPKYGSPQELLDALLGELSFDPLAFSRQDAKEQLVELRRICKIDLDFDALDQASAVDFKARTDINRRAKAKRAQVAALVVPAELPEHRIDESDLLNQLQAAAEHNANIETRRANREQAQRDAAAKRDRAQLLRTQADNAVTVAEHRVADLRLQIERAEEDGKRAALEFHGAATNEIRAAESIEAKLANAEALPQPIQIAALRTSLDAAKTTNAAFDVREQQVALVAEAVSLEQESAALTVAITEREKIKVTAVATAKMPIGGLGFGAGAITYYGLPFDQASSAEQLRVSCAIAMAANSKLRVIRIKDGSLLDEDGLAMLEQLAFENDYQIWLEKVDSSGKIGIVMEDGEVAGGRANG